MQIQATSLRWLFTEDERLVVADDVRVLELLAYDAEFTDDVADARLPFLRRLAPRRVQSTHL